MRLGGFVIHGNSRATLGRCLDSLAAVSDSCVAIDTGSSDGSAELARSRRVRRVQQRWEGYGAARAAAVQVLSDCDYVFFLDSDEWLEPEAVAALQEWKRSDPQAPHYAMRRRDWAELDGRRFLYRSEHHVRLVRRDAAVWNRGMIVHEALPRATTVRIPVALEHAFADSVSGMRSKVDRYALLWAIRNHREPRRVKPPRLQHLVHFLREALVKGAAFRGGLPALQLADAVAHHHARKYALLRDVRRGEYPELVQAFEEGRLSDLFHLISDGRPRLVSSLAPGVPLTLNPAVNASQSLVRASMSVRHGD